MRAAWRRADSNLVPTFHICVSSRCQR